jgi:hypothetical protein
VVLGGMFARHVAYVEVALLGDVVKVEARSVEGVDEFVFGLLGEGVGVEINGDCVRVVWVGRLGAEFERMSGGKGCEQGLGWWAEV